MVNGDNKDSAKNEDFVKYSSNSDPILEKDKKDINSSVDGDTTGKRLRTFSETLKMLDDDIIADLNVK